MIDTWKPLAGRSVFLTGHTGFKGSWLTLWLHSLGAEVTGYALDPPTAPSHFEAAKIGDLLAHDFRHDIRDAHALTSAVASCQPDVVFHLAAQPIVRESLLSPAATFEVNVMGTANMLDSVRSLNKPCAVLVITSDKCYRNEGQGWGFRESDPLGGDDPYSASKAGAELVVDAYRSSFFGHREGPVLLASARAGNVIGGGDWAVDRIVPDAIRALSSGSDLIVRNPASTRPWQHVLEPLSGYLTLASKLLEENGNRWAEAWNFGPLTTGEASVATLADAVIDSWGSGRWISPEAYAPDVEAKTLRISIDKAVSRLGWQPRWDFDETVRRTISWYKDFYANQTVSTQERSLEDIAAYQGS